MESQESEVKDMRNEFIKSNRRGKIMGGLLLVVIGSLYLAKEMGTLLPPWLFTWKALLIGLGIVSAIKHKFQHASWIILIGVGSIFLLNDIYPEMHIKPFLWPILIIFVGLIIMFKPRRKCYHRYHEHRFNRRWHKHDRHNWQNWKQMHDDEKAKSDNEDYIESTSVMAGIKKSVLSKSFKGGEITNILGGAEINLMQADIEDKAKLEITQVLGGTNLIVPANWEIKSELVTIMGGVEDKRPIQTKLTDEKSRILLLTGTIVLGGIEINSY